MVLLKPEAEATGPPVRPRRKARVPRGRGEAAASICKHRVDLFRCFLFSEAAGLNPLDGWHSGQHSLELVQFLE